MRRVLMVWLAVLLIPLAFASSHTDGTCEVTAISPDSIFTGISGSVPVSLKEGEAVVMTTPIAFASGTPAERVYAEFGLYPADSQAALSIVNDQINADANPTRNCVLNEPFVDTVEINTLGGGAEVLVTFSVTAPVDASLNDGGSRDYVYQLVVFKECYRECFGSTGSQPLFVATKPFVLLDDPAKSAQTSGDGVQNGDETDLDCGGSSGNPCPAGFSCDTGSDCANGLVCRYVGGSGDICTSEQPSGDETGGFGTVIMVGAVIVVVLGLLLVVIGLFGKR